MCVGLVYWVGLGLRLQRALKQTAHEWSQSFPPPQASQLNDHRKYSVVTALVRVLAENSFPPTLNQTTYKGFVIQSDSPATIVSTYGKQVLIVQPTDRDFADVSRGQTFWTMQDRVELFQRRCNFILFYISWNNWIPKNRFQLLCNTLVDESPLRFCSWVAVAEGCGLSVKHHSFHIIDGWLQGQTSIAC